MGEHSEWSSNLNMKSFARNMIQHGQYCQRAVSPLPSLASVADLPVGMYLFTDKDHTCGAVLGHPVHGTVCFDPHSGSAFRVAVAGSLPPWKGLEDAITTKAGVTSVKQAVRLWARATESAPWSFGDDPPASLPRRKRRRKGKKS